MKILRRLRIGRLAACATLAVSGVLAAGATPSMAVVGGQDAQPGEYPSVAEITFGKGFLQPP
jgi:hypothetical protein